MKLFALTLTLASLLNVCSAWTIEGSVYPHQGSEDTMINLHYEVNTTYSGTAKLKVCLNAHDFNKLSYDYSCDYNINEFNLTVPGVYDNLTFNLDAPSWLYRVCLKLTVNKSTYSDCDSDNTFMLIRGSTAPVIIANNTQPVISVESEVPDIANNKDAFTSQARITNNKDYSINITAYSYAYNGSRLLSEGFINDKWGKSWTANSATIELNPRETAVMKFVNKVNETGECDYRIRIRYASGEYYDVTRSILVLKKSESRLWLNPLVQLNESLRITVSNTGDLSGNASLILTSGNESIRHDFTVPDMKSIELRHNLSGDESVIHVHLLEDNYLVSSGLIILNKSIPSLMIHESTAEEADEVQTLFIIDSSSQIITASRAVGYSILSTEFPGTETVLNVIIVIVSIIGLCLLLRKY